MNYVSKPAAQIPIARETNVLVVGGGTAGMVAAIASARSGASTLLVERFACLGGTATASLMANINAFRNQVEPDATQTVRGIAEEIILKAKEMGGLGKSPYPQKDYPTLPGQLAYSYAVDPEVLKYLALKMAVEAGVQILFHTMFVESIVEGAKLQGIIVANKAGLQAILADVVVDASGDADVAASAGADFWQTRGEEASRLVDGLMYKIGFGARRPQKSWGCDFGDSAVTWGPAVPAADATDPVALTNSEITARLKVYEDLAEKQKNTPELADARIIETPPMIGIRQTRFVEGEYKITAEDAITGRRFDDVVALSSAPIIHFYGYRRYLEHEGYDIPYRALVPRKIDNLLMAGRCISSEQQPYESHRSMAPIMAIGHAAGVAAALCARERKKPRELNVQKLQEKLTEQNAFLYLNRG